MQWTNDLELLSSKYGRRTINDIYWVLMIFNFVLSIINSNSTFHLYMYTGAESLISMIETVKAVFYFATPSHHTCTHTHTLGHTVYYSKTSHMTHQHKITTARAAHCYSFNQVYLVPLTTAHTMSSVMWCRIVWNEGAKSCSTAQCACCHQTVLWRSPLSSLYLTV